MKRPTILRATAAGFCCLWLCVAGQARDASYPYRVRPKMTLATALALANHALGKEAKNFYCVGGNLGRTRALDGDWLLNFASSSSDTRFVDVGFDRRVWVHKSTDRATDYRPYSTW